MTVPNITQKKRLDPKNVDVSFQSFQNVFEGLLETF